MILIIYIVKLYQFILKELIIKLDMSTKLNDVKSVLVKILMIMTLFQTYFNDLIVAFTLFSAIILILVYRNKKITIDSNLKIIIIFFVSIVFSFVWNIINNNNNITILQYFKVFTNDIVWFLLVFISYYLGKSIAYDRTKENNIINFTLNLFFFNAVVSIIAWIVQTGGTIGRYNFISPITQSVSAGVGLSLIGFFLALSFEEKNKIILYLYEAVFIFNILIIVTRKVQIAFLLFFVYYYFLKFLNIKSNKIAIILGMVVFLVLTIFLGYEYIDIYSDYYTNIFSERGQDMLYRDTAQEAAIYMFNNSPIFGVGYGMFGLNNNFAYLGITLNSAHNGLYAILSECGALGLVCIIALFINIILQSHKVLKNNIETKFSDISYIVLIRGTMFLSLVANFKLFPPSTERSYYIEGFVLWIMIGIISSRANNFDSKKAKSNYKSKYIKG